MGLVRQTVQTVTVAILCSLWTSRRRFPACFLKDRIVKKSTFWMIGRFFTIFESRCGWYSGCDCRTIFFQPILKLPQRSFMVQHSLAITEMWNLNPQQDTKFWIANFPQLYFGRNKKDISMPCGSYKGKEKERVHSGGRRLPAPLPPHALLFRLVISWLLPGGGTPHMKGVGMLVVSLRGVNFGFWSHLGCLSKTPSHLAVKVLLKVAREKI